MSTSNLYLQCEWLKDKNILSYTLFSINKAVMSYWSEQVLRDLHEQNDADTVRLLFDLSHTNASMSYFVLTGRELLNAGVTKQGQEQLIEILEENSQRDYKLAVLLSQTMLGALSKYVPVRYEQSNFFGKIFFDYKKAEQWLVAEQFSSDSKTGTISDEILEEVLAEYGEQDPDVYGNRGTLRMLVMGSLEVVSISEDKPIVIGRGKEADLNVRTYGHASRSVSRQHIQIALKNGRLTITDLNSSNGTLLSGRRLEGGKENFLHRDDIIQIGMMEIEVVF
jgi:hypothetical protein